MHQRDKEKMTFMTNDANYFYKVMSLDLKNISVTYQRLIDKVFKCHIRHNVEVYVDVVKYESCEKHVEDLNKVFATLRKQ